MAKNYKETTTQAAVLRTSTKTLSFWCNIREAPLERFAELIEGNIRIALQDFSGGKGDKSKFAYFNLEISDIYEIKDCMQAKKSFFAQKIYGKHPETGGQFNGMCKSFHFALQYTEKAQNGELSRNPYYLCIKNGFAQAAPGQMILMLSYERLAVKNALTIVIWSNGFQEVLPDGLFAKPRERLTLKMRNPFLYRSAD